MRVHHILVWLLRNEYAHFPRRPGRPHLHWASPFMYRGQYALMYTIQADVGACIKSDCGHFYMNRALSQASWMPSPTLSISLYEERPVYTPVHMIVQENV